MFPHDTVVLGLLITVAVTSVVELGLSAYLVSGFHALSGYYGDYYGYNFYVPGQLSYLVFDSIWSLLATAFLIVVAFFSPKRLQNVGGKAIGFATLVVTAFTMLHWLAGFAALSALYGGYAAPGLLGALLAFAVISWLIYVALTVLNCLTAFGVLKSERRGRGRLFGHVTSTQHGGAGQPMSYETAPVHMQQPHQQAYPQPYQQPHQQPHQQPYQPPYQQPVYKNEQVVQNVDKV